ncbi:rCG62459 [Rattus norvegicus]|uniref:RCG62459 n=1 Tax=Rattus norvegicus TaxID=10116 RepID=A6J6H4_RAT|nr:rCG62459 [Rattus norvegicus]
MQDSHSSDKSTTEIIKRRCGGRPCFLKITQKGEGNTVGALPLASRTGGRGGPGNTEA